MAAAAELEENQWCAKLRLGFRKSPGRTQLTERARQGPLAVQKALYPEGELCHIYLLHPPGGVAGGDHLDIRASVARDASALVTTPGATKFYRSADPWAYQHHALEVTDGSLEWLPQENIIFPGAKVALSTAIDLSANAIFIGWEIHCLGRPAVAECFDRGEAIFSFRLRRNGQPLLYERLRISNEKALHSAAGLRGNPVIGTLCATLEDSLPMESIRQEFLSRQPMQLGITQVDGLFIARYLGDSTEQARYLFTEIWKMLRPVVLNRPPCAPRIWNT
ncbi:MAG: urease accessory protein UreD [Gammaproteobacteria bacterium]|nr:urease accessory protein UreD [Gammaproteobacteria bacterium]